MLDMTPCNLLREVLIDETSLTTSPIDSTPPGSASCKIWISILSISSEHRHTFSVAQ